MAQQNSASNVSGISQKMSAFINRSSWIRKMFEEGTKLKKQFGADQVCDFSLGNPDLSPPDDFFDALSDISSNNPSGIHGYMANAGFEECREAIAGLASQQQQIKIPARDITMTCGAAGGLNIIFKAILDPGDEVVVPSPFFVEYGFYVDNHGGVLKPVQCLPDFSLDLSSIEANITPKTKAILINSPNNPSGAVYDQSSLQQLASILTDASAKYSRPIYLISDEPYRRLSFDHVDVPPILNCYNNSIVTTSFSKDLSIPGERIGYVALNPDASDHDNLLNALILANRILGFVNAPAISQRIVSKCLHSCVDVSIYQARRDKLAEILSGAGYEFTMPRGAFYFFPKTPIEDDKKFVDILREERILAVPGSGFGAPGYIRIAFCVGDDVIERSKEGFERAINKARALK